MAFEQQSRIFLTISAPNHFFLDTPLTRPGFVDYTKKTKVMSALRI